MNDPMYFERYVLPSGLQVFFQHRNLGWFAGRVVVGVGQRHDPPGKEELSHLLEHHLSAGTQGLPRMDFTGLQRWAAAQRFEFDFGETAVDFSVYGGKAPVDRMEQFFRFLGALVLRPTLDGDIEHDRAIIRNERRQMTTPRARQIERIRNRALYGKHRLAKAIGWAENKVLNGLTIDDVREHHRRYYGSPNMAVVAVGGLDKRALLKVLEESFVPAPAVFAPPDKPAPIDFRPPRPGEYLSRKKDGKVTSVIIQYFWRLPPVHRSALMLVRNGLGDLLDARLREKLRAAYDVIVDTQHYQDHSVLTLVTEVEPDMVAPARAGIDAIVSQVDDLVGELPRLIDDFRLAVSFMELKTDETAAKGAMSVALLGGPRPMSRMAAELEGVTADEVRELLRSRINPAWAYVELVEE